MAVKGYQFDDQRVRRIAKTVQAHERKSELRRIPLEETFLAEQDPAGRMTWFQLDENLLPNGTPVDAHWVIWSPTLNKFVDDYDSPAGMKVVDRWQKFWGVIGEIGAAVPTMIDTNAVDNQVQICPGKNIYRGNIKAGQGDWTGNQTLTCETPILTVNRDVTVTDPGYIAGAGTGLAIPEASIVRFYCNVEEKRFELLDASTCPE